MGQSRVQQLGERITESGFVRNVIGPKVLEPVTVWYEENLRDDGEDQAAGLESARAAERFLDGDAQDPPVSAGAGSVGAPAPAASTLVADPDLDPAIEMAAMATVPDSRPEVGGWRGARDIAMRVKDRVKHHNLNVVAAGIAFWSLLAIPAVLTSIISIYGLVASPDEVEDQINDLLSGVSAEAQKVVSDQLTNITSGDPGGLLAVAVFGIVLALWSASGAVAKLITTMNTIWEVREDRKFVALRGVAVALTFGAIVFFLSTVAALAIVPAILGETALGDVARWTINLARFPALLVFMMIGLTFLYWFGPNRHAKWRLLTWGAFIATVGWLLLSGLFSIYTANFAAYNETYAAMGSVVVLLLWMFITAFMVLVGAEIDAAREERDRELAVFDDAT